MAARRALAELIVPILGSIDKMTEDLSLLVTREGICDTVCS